jgi:hypothetical protein
MDTGTQGHNFGTQFAFDVNKQLGKLETGLEQIEKRLEKIEDRTELMRSELTSLKSSIDTLRPIVENFIRGMWGVVIVILTGAVALIVYWAKSKLGI